MAAPDSPPLDHLIRLPSSAELEATAREARDELARLEREYPPGSPTGWGAKPLLDGQRQRTETAESQREAGQQRDALAAGRPGGCWCLGQGGESPLWLGRNVETGAEGHGWRRYCGCPEGQAAEGAAQAFRRALGVAERRAWIHRLQAQANIPARFQEYRFANFPATAATAPIVARIREWIGGPEESADVEADEVAWAAWHQRRQSLLLYGVYGTGKTALAVASLKAWMRNTEEAGLFVTVPDLLDAIREGYNERDQRPSVDLCKQARQTPFLVLDDLGAERVTEWVRERLFVVINARHDNDLPTIFTSNLGPDELGEHLGERITWRIVEMADVIHLDGPNLRDRPAP